MIDILPDLSIDDNEVSFSASRSAGPGGQNVNKVATRVTLRFDVAASASLDDDSRQRILDHLATRIDKNGVLAVRSQRHRTQAANRRAAQERFVELLREALETSPERQPTRVPRRARERRLIDKRRRAEIKQGRSGRFED